jgi:hypothetical protein
MTICKLLKSQATKSLRLPNIINISPQSQKKKKKKKQVRKNRQKDTLIRRTVLRCSFHPVSRNKLLMVTIEQVLIYQVLIIIV